MAQKKKKLARKIRAMEPDRFLNLLGKLCLSQRAAGRFLGIADRTVRALVSGDAAIDPPTAMLLEIMARHHIAPEEALRMIGIDVRAAAKATVERLGPFASPRYYENFKT
jgi:DNA-binding transcriptional regulator YiaG